MWRRQAGEKLCLHPAKTRCLVVNSVVPARQYAAAAAPFQVVDYAEQAESVLGVPVGPPSVQQHFMHNKICGAIAVLRRLADLHLHLAGRSRAAKAYVFSRVAYFMDLCAVADADCRSLQHALFDFVAQNKCRPRVRWWRMALNRACQPLAAGGLGVVHVHSWVTAARVKWFTRFVSGPEHPWKWVFADIFGQHPVPVVVPRAVRARMLAVTWINHLLPSYPVLAAPKDTREFILSQPIFDNPLVVLPNPVGVPVPLRSTASTWAALSKKLHTVADVWDCSTSSFITFRQFHALAARIQRQQSRYRDVCSAISAAWPNISQVPAVGHSAPGVLISDKWVPADGFRVSMAALALLQPVQSVTSWWQSRYGGPQVQPALFRRLLKLPLPPSVRQTLILYAEGALALAGNLPWLSGGERVCGLCGMAVEDPVHFPIQCLGLHATWDLCAAAGSLLGLPLAVPQDRSLIAFLAQPAAMVSDAALVAAGLYLHVAWRVRVHHRDGAAFPALPLVLQWLCWEFQALLNGRDCELRQSLRTGLCAAHLATMKGASCLLLFPEVEGKLAGTLMGS